MERKRENSIQLAQQITRLCRQILEVFIKELPFCVPAEILSLFNSAQQRSSPEIIKQTAQFLTTTGSQIKISTTAENIKTLHNILTQFQFELVVLYNNPKANVSVSGYFSASPSSQQHRVLLAKICQDIQNLKGEAVKNFQKQHLAQGNQFDRLLGNYEEVKAVKQWQHNIHSLRESLYSFSSTHNHLAKTFYPGDTTLDEKNYSDLVLCAALFKPDFIVNALKRQYDVIAFYHQKRIKNLEILKNRLGRGFSSCLRLMRMISLYQRWFHILKQQEKTLDSVVVQKPQQINLSYRLRRAVAVNLLCTYQKKAFLQNGLNNQLFYVVLDALYQFIQQQERLLSPQKIFKILQREKQNICQQIEVLEAYLLQPHSLLEKSLAILILGITQQPMYQLGCLANRSLTSIADRFSSKLDENFESKWRHAQGVVYLALSFFAASWFNYSYHFIASVNRFLFSQVNWLFRCGDFYNKILQMTVLPCLEKLQTFIPEDWQGVVEWAKDRCRFDEIGLLEKDHFFQWITGLGINLTLAGIDEIGYHTGGYVLATVGAATVENISAACCRRFTSNPHITHGIQAFSHITSYPIMYIWGYRLTRHILPLQNTARLEALKLFGLHGKSTQKEIRRRYWSLSLKHHPDRCRSGCTELQEKIIEINQGYTLFKKEFSG